MGRIIMGIEIEGATAAALFDTGALHSYVRQDLVENAMRFAEPVPRRVVLGGQTIEFHERRYITGKIEGLPFGTAVVPVESLGRLDGTDLDAIIGAITMEEWHIRPDPRSGTLDLEGLRRRDYIEYGERGGNAPG